MIIAAEPLLAAMEIINVVIIMITINLVVIVMIVIATVIEHACWYYTIDS